MIEPKREKEKFITQFTIQIDFTKPFLVNSIKNLNICNIKNKQNNQKIKILQEINNDDFEKITKTPISDIGVSCETYSNMLTLTISRKMSESELDDDYKNQKTKALKEAEDLKEKAEAIISKLNPDK